MTLKKIPCEDIWRDLFDFSEDFNTIIAEKFSAYSDLAISCMEKGRLGDKQERIKTIMIRKKDSPNERFFVTLRVSNFHKYDINDIIEKENEINTEQLQKAIDNREEHFKALRDIHDVIHLATYEINAFNNIIIDDTTHLCSLDSKADETQKANAYNLIKNSSRINVLSDQINQRIHKIFLALELLEIVEKDLRTGKIDPRYYEQSRNESI